MATVQATRGTYASGTTETSLVRDVSERIAQLQPDAAPLITFLSALKRKKEAKNPKFEWFEDDLVPCTVNANNAAGTGAAIQLTAAQSVIVRNGDILVAPNGESMLITAGAGNSSGGDITVTRAIGTTPAAFTLAAGDELIVAGSAITEGSNTPAYRYVTKTPKLNYIQIFRDPIKITTTQEASESYGGDDRTYQRKKVAIEHKRAIELAFLFGNASATADATNVGYLRTTKGLFNWISTNVTNVGGTITESEMETFLRTLFRYQASTGPQTKILLASPIMVSALNFWAKNALQVTSDEKVYGMRVATYRSGHGDLSFVRHWLLGDFATGDVGTSPLLSWSGYSFALDPANMGYRFLSGLDTKLHTDIGDKTYEYKLDEYRTHAGLQLELEKTHGILSYVTGYAA
jgi:hypothetical protein